MISAGEVHLPGRPKDIVGLKALAIVAVRAFANLRPAGVKVHAGAPILELGLEEADFAELAAAGVNLVGEVGLGSVKTGAQAAPMLALGARSTAWCPRSTPAARRSPGRAPSARTSCSRRAPTSSATSTAARPPSPTPTSSSWSRAGWRSRSSTAATAGRRCTRSGWRRETGALDRVILGNDAPSGTGVVPLGILRTMAHLASLGGIAPETAVCLATGNTARVHRLETGTIAVGREADIALVDAPQGSAADSALGALAIGDLPGRRDDPHRRQAGHRPQPQHAARRARTRGRQGPGLAAAGH